MYNLKSCKGTFKGLIGECMFKLTQKKVILPFYCYKQKFLTQFSAYLSQEQRQFLIDHWYSLDAIEVCLIPKKEIVLYEVKTCTHYQIYHKLVPKMTLHTHHLYEHAQTLGFTVKLVRVIFYNDWNYDLEITPLSQRNYCIDRPKTYDWRAINEHHTAEKV